ncbi:MAG: glycosyltransferase family 4 protein [Ignavibacteria bacterium]
MTDVVFFTNIPAHYRVALIKRVFPMLRKDNVSLTTVFSKSTYDRRKYWDTDKVKFDFDYRILDSGNSFSYNNKLYELGLGARKILGELQPRLVILSGYSLLSYNVSKYCLKYKIPYLIYTGETSVTAKDFDGNPIRKFLRKRLAANSAGYIVYGTKAGDYIKDKYSVNEEKVFEVINTIDTDEFGRRLDEAERTETNKYVILFVGELVGLKGVDLLLKAVPLIDTSVREKIELRIVGTGKELNKLTALASNLSPDNVRFFGRIDYEDIVRFYKDCDLFVLPSTKERFGLVLVEAAAAGKALIASQYCGGAHDIIEEGKNGFIINPYDTKGFANKLEFLISSEELTKEFGRHSLEIIKNRININIAANSLYKAIMENLD